MSKFIWLSFSILLLILLLNTTQDYFKEKASKSVNDPRINNLISPVFDDETLNWQLYARHRQSGKKLTGLNEILGSGACIIDYNNDGWEDIFVVGGSGQHRFYGKHAWWSEPVGNTLWKNTGHDSFINVSDKANIPITSWGMGCAVGDLDNDGDMDLLILNIGKNFLLENNGNGTFVDISSASGISDDENWSLSASMADYNGDGLLDIYISNFIDYNKNKNIFERSSGFSNKLDTFFDPILYNSQSNNLYENKGSMRFSDEADSLEVADATGRGKAVHWIDVNEDQLPDLVVLNSGGSPNQLYINQGVEEGFKTNSSLYHVESAVGSHSAAVGDVDNDGDIDMVFSRPSGTPPMLLINRVSIKERIGKNKNGYEDLAWQMGLANNERLFQDGWGTVLKDFNNDGWLDLYMANGLAMVDSDSNRITIGQDDAIWINNHGHFELTDLSSPYKLPSRGAVTADFNNDGLMDLLVTQNNGFVRLLINKTKSDNHWIGVVLEDKNKTVISAKVTLKSTSITQVKQLYMESSYLSQSTSRMHFGLPAKDEIISLMIKWPDGTTQTFKNIKPNQYIVANKGINTFSTLPIKTTPETDANSLYLTLDDTNKRLYIEVLSLAKGSEGASKELMLALEHPNPTIRKKALNGLYLIRSPLLLSAIYDSISDESEIVRSHAINISEKLEIDRTVPWLINALSDKNTDVKCNAANAFEHFFREEEAAIIQKYLSIPHLILLLSDSDAKVRKCAANALAESDSYRGVAPLTNLIYDKDINVRSSAARALGFLRNGAALKPLEKSAMSLEQPARVKAYTIMSLEILNADIANEVLDNLLTPQNNIEEVINAMEIIDALSMIDESMILNWKKIDLYRNKLSKQACLIKGNEHCFSMKTHAEKHHKTTAKKDAQTILVTKEYSYEIKGLIHLINDKSQDTTTRQEALGYLIRNNHPLAKSLAINLIKNDSDIISADFLGQLKYFHNDADLRQVLWDILDNNANKQKIRLVVAKVLILNEPEKVMDTLFDMNQPQ